MDLQVEYHHNIITQNEPDEGQSKEYSPSNAMLMARLIYHLNTKMLAVSTQQRTEDFWTECVRRLKEGNGSITLTELLYSNVNRQSDSNRMDKSPTSADVPRREARWNHGRKNGL